MFTEELTQASPQGSPFVLAERTLVQGAIMGEELDGSGGSNIDESITRVLIFKEKTDGQGDYAYYNHEIKKGPNKDFNLSAGRYRTVVDGAKSDTLAVVHLSPVTAE